MQINQSFERKNFTQSSIEKKLLSLKKWNLLTKIKCLYQQQYQKNRYFEQK